MTDIPKGLTPANQNPWYVLMTLYGEQEEEEVDEELHAKNRAAWNAWACQGMEERERAEAAESSGVTVAELSAWPEMKGVVGKRHKAEWEIRNGEALSYPGLPDVEVFVEMSGVEFSRNFEMSRAVFGSATWFIGASFAKRADFRYAFFNNGAWFGSSVFGRDSWFNSTTFKSEAQFNRSTFCGGAWFGASSFEVASFHRATFGHDAWFRSATFSGPAWFDDVEFQGPTFFDFAKFSNVATFVATAFGKSATFDDVWFDGNVGFGGASFSEETSFLGATFTSNSWFGGAVFGGFAHFMRSEFGSVTGSQIAGFTDCQFEKPASFRDATFHATYPDFSGAVLHDNVAFSDDADHWPLGPQSNPAAAKASCAVIRHNLGKQGLPEAEHFFFRREMGFAGQIGGWWQRLPYRAFGAFSDYGYSIARPALWLLGLWVAVAMVNHVVLQWGASMATVADYHPAQAFGLSFANLFPVFGFHKLWFDPAYLTGLNGWLKFLGGVQTIASLPLLFFLGLGLRTRFRLR